MSKSRTVIFPNLLLGILLLGSTLTFAADEEYREHYYVSLDSNGVIYDGTFTHEHLDPTIETSGGEGLGWYYYPASDRYIMWYSNGSFDEDSSTAIEFHAFLAAVDASQKLSYDMRIGWTNRNWIDNTSPPLPEDLPTLDDENNVLQQGAVYSQTNMKFSESSTYEPSRTLNTYNYRPAWIYVSFSGKNVWVWRWIGRTNTSDEETTTGACCNTETGDCYLTTSGSCSSGYTYLGDGTSCSACDSTAYDYGDAPSSYPVLLADNGARHAIANDLYLGDNVDADSDGSPSSSADSDDYDDGITFLTELIAGETAIIQVNASNIGLLNAWIDYNADGDWDDDNEQIATDALVSAGDNYLSVDVPSSAVSGTTYARFRLSSSGGLEPGGTAADGEVEDYLVVITSDIVTTSSTAVDPNMQPLPFVSQPCPWTDSSSELIVGLPQDSLSLQGPLVLDDWTYTSEYPVQGIRWWGTFADWSTTTSLPDDLPTAFQISLWSSNSSGGPDVMLWEMTTNQYTWAYSGLLQDIQGVASGQAVFEFSVMLSQDEWFDLGTDLAGQYWIGIAAEYESVPTESWSWLAQATVDNEAALQIDQIYNGWPADFDSIILSSSTVEYPTNTTWDMAFELLSPQTSSSGLAGDMNGDGVIDTTDLNLLMQIVIQ